MTRRRLIGQPLLVTFRLCDSLPVHLLLTPQVGVSKLLGSLKAASARRANLIGSDHEFRRIQWYIENNPVTACLAARPEEYAWSSAGRPERPPQAEGLPHHELQ